MGYRRDVRNQLSIRRHSERDKLGMVVLAKFPQKCLRIDRTMDNGRSSERMPLPACWWSVAS